MSITLAYVVPFLVMLVICFQIYHIVPNRQVSARAALLGAVFTGLLWEAAKHLFTWYVSAFGSYSLLYGSLSAAAVLLVWTYYSAAVLLLGAEVTCCWRKNSRRGPRDEGTTLHRPAVQCRSLSRAEGCRVYRVHYRAPLSWCARPGCRAGAAGRSTQTPPASTVPVDSPGALPQQTSTPDRVWRDPKTGIEFVRIPEGAFDMGSTSFANEKPVHRVHIAEFWLAKTEVTQAQWRSIMGGTPSKERGCNDCPVGEVSWEDVQSISRGRRTDYRPRPSGNMPQAAVLNTSGGQGPATRPSWVSTSGIGATL